MLKNEILQKIKNNRDAIGFYEAFDLKMAGIEDIIKHNIKDFLKNDRIRKMQEGIDYYKLKHSILGRRIVYKVNGVCYESPLANRKIRNPYYRLLVDQKAGYMAGNWSIISKDEKLNEVIEEVLLDKETLNELIEEIVVDAANQGDCWVHMYKNEEGEIKLTTIPSAEIIPIFDSNFEKTLEAVIRFYKITHYQKNGDKKEYYKVEYWNDRYVSYYIFDEEEDEVYLDTEKELNPRPHFITVTKKGDIIEDNFGMIPFVQIKNNKFCLTDLEPVKDYIDDLDLITSDWSNEFENNLEGVWIFEGGDPNQPLHELLKGIKASGGIKLPEGMKVTKYTFPIEYEARQAKIQELKYSIFSVGQGVDTNDKDLYGNLSGIAIKLKFSALTIKCKKIETYIKKALYKILYAMITEYNKVNGTNFDPATINIKSSFNVLEDTEEISKRTETALSLKGVVSDRTLLNNLPQVSNVDEELRLLEEQKAENPDNLII